MNEALKDPDVLAFLVYKSVEGVLNGLEEYKIGKHIGYLNGAYKKGVKELINEYVEKLPLFERLTVKAMMFLPWSETVAFLSRIALNFGKKDDGTYKNTIDVITDLLGKYLG